MVCSYHKAITLSTVVSAGRLVIDYLAAACTCTSTLLLATHHHAGWYFLAVGACLWGTVALRGRYAGRRVWGMVASSAWTFCWSVYAIWHG